jgi:CubicO group peptidase (beta-lactamase class C family)
MAIECVAIAGLLAALPAGAALDPADAVARIDRRLTSAAADGSGFAIIVERNGAVILRKGYGLANRTTGEPFTTDTIAQIGSLTKQFTATAALTLVHRGALELDAPVKTYLPGAPAALASVTVRQLLTHTGGLPEDCGDDFDRMSLAKMLSDCLSRPLLHPPGTGYAYSNPGFSVVAAVVEAVSGRPLERFLRDELLEPNGLRHTGSTFPRGSQRGFAHGYSNGADQGVVSDRIAALGDDWWNLKGNGGLQASAEDMYRWHLALSGKGKLDARTLHALRTPHTAWKDGVARGYGWFFRDDGTGEPRQMSHAGSDGVFFAAYWDRLQDGVFVYLVGNGGEAPVKAALSAVLDVVREAFVAPPPAGP